MSDSQVIRFDVSAVPDSDVRSALRRDLEKRSWSAVGESLNGYGPILFVGDASRLLKKGRFLESRLKYPTGVVALIGDRRGSSTAEIEQWALDPKLTVGFEIGDWKSVTSRLLEKIESIAERLAPDRIRFAEMVGDQLVVSFGDGFARIFDWNRTKALSNARGGRPVAATVGEDFDAVVVRLESGREIDVDGMFLRRLADPMHAAESDAGFAEAKHGIGARLRALREKSKLSQEELQARTGLAQESISRLESGTRIPRLSTLARLAKGLGVPLERLLRELEWD